MSEPISGSVAQQTPSRRFRGRFRSAERWMRVVFTRRMRSAVTVSVKVESTLSLLVMYGVLGGVAAIVVR